MISVLKIIHQILLGILALLPCQLAAAENPRTTAATVLTTLQPGHPRLLLAPGRVAAIQQLIARDAVAAHVYESLTNSAENILSQNRRITNCRMAGDFYPSVGACWSA